MSAKIERLALEAIATDDGDIGFGTLKAVQGDLLVLFSALTSDAGVPCNERIAEFVSLIINRIDLALALAEADQKAEAAQ